MKELSKEMQMVYDFCEKKKNNLDKSKAADFRLQMQFIAQAGCYRDIQSFIEVNFMEEDYYES